MKAESIRPRTIIGGRTVARAVNGTATFRVAKSSYLAAARLVTFVDGTTAAFEHGSVVDALGWAEPLPAGGVASTVVKTPTKVRASRKDWRGERDKPAGMSTRHHDLIAGTNMFDTGRVNGTVGAARGGAGPVFLTGQSF